MKTKDFCAASIHPATAALGSKRILHNFTGTLQRPFNWSYNEHGTTNRQHQYAEKSPWKNQSEQEKIFLNTWKNPLGKFPQSTRKNILICA